MESLIHTLTDTLARSIEAAAALIIAIGVLDAVLGLSRLFVPHTAQTPEAIRLRLGRWLSLALEFELAADVLRTAITPTWSDLGKLAAIVVIRTTINIFLQQEIEKGLAAGTLPAGSRRSQASL
jgi:uncharacterized membrane protein